MTPQDEANFRNPLWRLSHFYKCREEGSGRPIPFILRPEQTEVVRHLIEKPLVPLFIIKSRRLGISTLIDTLQVDCAAFSSGFRGVIIDQTQADATKKMVEIVRFALDNMPPEILKDLVADKRNDSELRLRMKTEDESKDSVIYATTTARGGDASFLHISEYGPIAATDAARAREIRTGAFPSARKGRRVIETTWYGGKSGDLWDLVKPILDGNPNAEGVVMFFPWHADPSAVKITGEVTPEIEDYFRALEAKTQKKFTDSQKKWYAAKKIEQGIWVRREFPSTLDEALSVPMAGTIYGEIIDQLREKKRIHDFPAEQGMAAYTFWDIGLSDYGCIWLVQFVGRDILLLDYCSATGQPAGYYTGVCKRWERDHAVTIRRHYLPHDAETRERSSGRTYRDALVTAGLHSKEITVVPRTPDIWLGINELKGMLQRCYIHASNCGKQSREKGGIVVPSGIDCLEYYHKRVETGTGGMIHEQPVHDGYSHGADAARTMAEAYRQGMIEGSSFTARQNRDRPVNVLRGAGPESYGGVKRQVNVIR